MTTNRSAALALIAGSLAGLVIMALHPTGGDLAGDSSGHMLSVARIVHWLAIVAEPLLLAGMLCLTLRLRANPALAFGAYVFFAVAGIAIVLAAVASGIVSTDLLERMSDANDASAAMMHELQHYSVLWNQAFASVFVVLSAIAIALWSGAIIAGRELHRALGVYGLILGAALLVGMASGHLMLGVHGFALVLFGEGIWMIWAAVALWSDASVADSSKL